MVKRLSERIKDSRKGLIYYRVSYVPKGKRKRILSNLDFLTRKEAKKYIKSRQSFKRGGNPRIRKIKRGY